MICNVWDWYYFVSLVSFKKKQMRKEDTRDYFALFLFLVISHSTLNSSVVLAKEARKHENITILQKRIEKKLEINSHSRCVQKINKRLGLQEELVRLQIRWDCVAKLFSVSVRTREQDNISTGFTINS